MALLSNLLIGVIALLWVPVLILLLELRWAWSPPRRPDTGTPRPRVALLIPAHNEQAGLAATLDCVRPQLRPGDRLLVVADNCTDATAAVARHGGAEVGERRDAQRRGKGYALDFGLRLLASAPPQVLIVVDADCAVAPGAIDALACQAAATQRPAQACYLMQAAAAAALPRRLAEFAWTVKNALRPRGLHAAGLPCQLTGSGMAFPWDLLGTVNLANGNLVEDMQLGLDLAAAGAAPRFCAAALVTSTFPTDSDAIAAQRARWEHGHLALVLGAARRHAGRALWRRNWAALALLADLAVPPLALLLLLSSAAGAAALLGLLAGAGWLALALSALQLGALAAFVLGAWWCCARHRLSLADLGGALAYAARKLPLYGRFLRARQKSWVRTGRD